MKVWIMIADYGLNGVGILGVWNDKPSKETCKKIENTNYEGQPYGPRSTTGYGGYEVEEWEVQECPKSAS